jgi:hypothetical protein
VTPLRRLLALLRLRGAGVTLVEIDRTTLAEELWSFGEDDLYLEPLSMADEDMVRVWVSAGKLLMSESARSSGEAGALAAVEVIEGRRRPLARRRRRRQADRPAFDRTPEERYDEIRRIEDSNSFPEHWG